MSFEIHSEFDAGINEINMTPLVDVMLVLLIIFIVTIPAVKQAIDIDLPDVANPSAAQDFTTIEISVTANGDYLIDGELTDIENLKLKFNEVATIQKELASDHMTLVHIHGDKNAKYDSIAHVMSIAQQNGINRIGFVMDQEIKHLGH
jgi:biopolymer transport protein ExbD